jgi:hypothetical protein
MESASIFSNQERDKEKDDLINSLKNEIKMIK